MSDPNISEAHTSEPPPLSLSFLPELSVLSVLSMLSMLSVASLGCDDSNTQAQGGVMAGVSAGVLGGVSSGDEVPLGAVNAGSSAVSGAEPPIGGGLCEPCDEACAPLECDCPNDPNGVSTFEGCQEGCCQAPSDAVCAQLCATLEPPPECELGEQRCLEGTPSAIQRCSASRQWEVDACPQDTACALDDCLPLDCEEGSRRCLDQTQVLSCEGGEWVVSEACDQVCADGACTTPSCAAAVRERSYLGCEYLALELPNLVSRDPVSAPPVAVVLTNPSPNESASVTIYGPEGEVSPLRGLALLPLPDVVSDHPDYQQAQTVRSEVRDASGALVEESVSRADQLLIPPGGVGTFLLPHTAWPEEGSLVAQNAFRVVSDHPVGAYQFAPYCCNYSFSNDASLLIPTSALSGTYRYLGAPSLLTFDSIGFPRGYPATMAVVATKDNTVVNLSLGVQAAIQNDTSGRLSVERGRYVARLNRQETLLIRTPIDDQSTIFDRRPQADLTGSWVEASEPVVVFSGHECSFYPQNLEACDHLEEQLFPVESWGRAFNLVPPPERGSSTFERVYWKFLAAEADTHLTLSADLPTLEATGPGEGGVPDCATLRDPQDPRVIILGEGGYCELSTKEAFAVSADKPISVMGIISGQNSVQTNAGFGAHLGDPSIFMAAPARQYRSDYAFLTPNTYFSDFLTIAFNEGTVVNLDGEELDLSGAQTLQGAQGKFIHVPLTDGPHALRASAPVGITVFAFDDFVSYAFTGGLNLTKR